MCRVTSVYDLVDQVVDQGGHDTLPPGAREIAERHRQTLLDLAAALLAVGRAEDEVAMVIEKASESFSTKLKLQSEGMPS